MLAHDPKDLALILKARRKDIDLSQARTADLIGLKQNTVSAFEQQPNGTKLETLFRLLSALDLELHIEPKQQQNKGNDEW